MPVYICYAERLAQNKVEGAAETSFMMSFS